MREIEAQLAAMSPANRDAVVQGIRAIVVGMLKLREAGLTVGKMATSKAAGQLLIWSASESLPEIVEHIKAQAAEVGPHVEALFTSV